MGEEFLHSGREAVFMSMTPTLKVKKLFDDAIVPKKAHSTDSGYDLTVYRFEILYKKFGGSEIIENPLDADTLTLIPGQRALINTGISATVGPGYEIQIRPRSGLALKQGLTVLNTPGTIDEAYRGMIGVIVINSSTVSQRLEKRMRIAQMVVCPVILCETDIVGDLNVTVRGEGGFGSTGAL